MTYQHKEQRNGYWVRWRRDEEREDGGGVERIPKRLVYLIAMKDEVELTHILEALVKCLDEDLDKVQDAQVRLLGEFGSVVSGLFALGRARAWEHNHSTIERHSTIGRKRQVAVVD